MGIGWNIIWFIVGVSLLVTIHEYGHFWVARRLGFKVLRFSVGFGKPLFKKIGRAPDHTEYVLAALPLGGYVRMLDDRDGPVEPADLPRSFQSKPPWQRILVMLAGPGANFLFAILVLWAMYWYSGVTHLKAEVSQVVAGSPAAAAGLRTGDEILTIDGERILDQGDAALGLLDSVSDDGEAVMSVRDANGRERSVTLVVDDPAEAHRLTEPDRLFPGLCFHFWRPQRPAIVGGVLPDGPAALAGLEAGDQVIAVDGSPIRYFEELANYINARPGEDIVLTVRRADDQFTRKLVIARDVVEGRTLGRIRIEEPRIDVKIPKDKITSTDVGPVGAFTYSVGKAWQMTVAQAKFFVRMLTGKVSTKNISGFVSIAEYAGDAARAGAANFLMLLVLLSLSLGFLNLLPIPILDGGQIVFQLAEWAKGGPLSDRTYLVGQQAGLALLVLLMGLALFNDLSGIFAVRP